MSTNSNPLKVVALERVFEDGGVLLKDPAPGMTTTAAIRILAGTGRPHLATCEVRGPVQRGNQAVFTLHRQVGTKGLLPAMTATNTRKRIGGMVESMSNLAQYERRKPVQLSDPATASLASSLAQVCLGDTPLALPSSALPWTF